MQANQTSYQVTEGNYDRPTSITLIAILLILGGGILAVTQLISFASLTDASADIGVPAVLLQGSIAFLGILGIAAGIGAWTGKKWGWWLAIFYFAYAIARNVNALVSINDVVNLLGAPGQGVASYYIKYGFRVLWNALLFLFLLRSETVNIYFKTENTPKWKAAAVVFGIVILLFIVITNLV
ncbi:hypothetical protein [Paenibacillus turpanensis]|uniref:hypothetical protein n=1 Tax=Paenibacillus turpanensis TaxID=2689078 RepID=UPI00140B07A5|nr:hypothetical protein [Paenibacillus turpanensis]